jgi:hypothetical protein
MSNDRPAPRAAPPHQIFDWARVTRDIVLKSSNNDPVVLKAVDLIISHPDQDHTIVVEVKSELSISCEPPTPRVEPPPLGEFLLHLCARTKRQQAALGDLNETFNQNCAQLDRARATRLYWAEVLRSVGPLIVRVLGRLVKWGAILDAIKTHFL